MDKLIIINPWDQKNTLTNFRKLHIYIHIYHGNITVMYDFKINWTNKYLILYNFYITIIYLKPHTHVLYSELWCLKVAYVKT